MNKKTEFKQKTIVAVTLALLLIFSAVMWVINGNSFENDDIKSITITAFGDEILIADDAYIKALNSETFSAVIRSSGKKPEEAQYTGVTVLELLESAGAQLNNAGKVIFRGTDGYASALSIDEIMEDKSVYLVYGLNGSDIKGKSSGGNGPYQLVIRKDPFSQRWCKYVTEVEVQ